jgi:5-formyltetrahydrofolate cyclo-ligase
MINGIGFSEIVLIALIVLLFFGSKELPQFIRKASGFMGKIKQATDKVRSEINSLAAPLQEMPVVPDAGAERKKELRTMYSVKRKSIPPTDRNLLSMQIIETLCKLPHYQNAQAICVYVSSPYEVNTREFIDTCILEGKRVIIPYCKKSTRNLGIAEIKNIHTDTTIGDFGILEPHSHLRDNFLRSDLTIIVCPGVAFDRFGGRLGHGGGYYDSFLRELKDRCYFVGIAFGCQIVENSLPFSYHDIPMDQIITENGLLIAPPTTQPG